MDSENTPDFVTTILNVGTHFADDEALKALYSAYGSTNIPEEFAIVRNEDGSYDVIRADEVDDPSAVVTEPPFMLDEADTPAQAVAAEGIRRKATSRSSSAGTKMRTRTKKKPLASP